MTEVEDIHITQRVFWWSMVVIMAVLGYFATKISALETQVNDNRVLQAKIETQLAQIQADITEIKASIKEHSAK